MRTDMHAEMRFDLRRIVRSVTRENRARYGLVPSAVCGTLLVTGCGSDTTGPVASTESSYLQVQLNHHAITLGRLAPYDTIQLTATPFDIAGAPIATATKAVYTTSDTAITIDSTGFVRVHWTDASTRTGIIVVATLTVGNAQQTVTHVDTAIVSVVDPAGTQPHFDSLVFHPVANDSARRAVVDTAGKTNVKQTFVSPTVMWSGVSIPSAFVHYASSNSLVATFTTTNSTGAPVVNANFPGITLLTAEATVYGVRRIDSVWYTVGYPLRVIASYGTGERLFNGSNPDTLTRVNKTPAAQITIGQGGAVLWGNSLANVTDDSLDVVFDDTTSVEGLPTPFIFAGGLGKITIPVGLGGNIPAFSSARYVKSGGFYLLSYDSTTSKARQFPATGSYHWVSQHQRVSGTVVVVSNASMQPH